MTREELEALGLTKEQIDKILGMHHKELDPVKKDLEEFKDADVSGMKKKIEDLEADIKTKDADHQREIADRDFNDLLKESIAGVKGKMQRRSPPFWM